MQNWFWKYLTNTPPLLSIFFPQVTPLHLAAWFRSSASVVRTLIDAGSNVNVLDSLQSSPLHYASMENSAVVPVLLAAGANVNQLDSFQHSPLADAARWDRRDVVFALIEASADPHLGKSPLEDSDVSEEMKAYIRSLTS